MSLSEIIEQQATINFPGRKEIYKLPVFSYDSATSITANVNRVRNVFFSIKVKKQMYLGKPAIAVHIVEATKKIREKLQRI